MMGEHRARGGMVIAATHLALDLDDARTLTLSVAA
jgi:ABC-type transport system involved in cytochrome c biogenesis ATPase subunit